MKNQVCLSVFSQSNCISQCGVLPNMAAAGRAGSVTDCLLIQLQSSHTTALAASV